MRATPVLVCGRRTTCWRRSTSPTLTSVVDLGCGAGVVFPALRARFPNARLTGVDQSAAMLAKAAQADAAAMLVEADAAVWRPDRPVDLIYSNALLQWVPAPCRADARTARLLPYPGAADACQFRLAVPATDRRAGQGGAVARSPWSVCNLARTCCRPAATSPFMKACRRHGRSLGDHLSPAAGRRRSGAGLVARYDLAAGPCSLGRRRKRGNARVRAATCRSLASGLPRRR